ncbi:MAG TPA: aromatic amino acid ammonia-lyase, partial [Patescibacteria group bacterium]|nr:aromatic amino acid ammonia-lyase [Patescibacteria group bacterium]
MKNIILDGRSLTINDVKAVARDGAKVAITKDAALRCERGYDVLQEKINQKIKIYGVTTGFGEFSQVFIEPDQAAQLQLNLIRSHSTGVGDPVSEEVVRATMLIRANFITSGLSGGRLLLAQTLVDVLNRRVTPYVLEQGSVGSSGDLAPLAMMMLTLVGEGQTYFQGKLMSSKRAMTKAGIPLVKLQAKEGLALINGDTFMAGMGSLELYDALQIAKVSEIAIATT